MKDIKRTLLTASLLVALFVSSCKKDEDPTPAPPTKETELTLTQGQGTPLKEHTALTIAVGGSTSLTVNVPENEYTATVTPTGSAQAVTVTKQGNTLLIKVLQQPAEPTSVVITYKKQTFTLGIVVPQVAPLAQGLYNAQGERLSQFRYVARKAKELWLAESVQKLTTHYLKVEATEPLTALTEGKTVKVTAKGIAPDKLQGDFTVKVLANRYQLSNTHYTIVVNKP